MATTFGMALLLSKQILLVIRITQLRLDCKPDSDFDMSACFRPEASSSGVDWTRFLCNAHLGLRQLLEAQSNRKAGQPSPT